MGSVQYFEKRGMVLEKSYDVSKESKMNARPTFSQFLSLRKSANFMYFRNVVRRVLKLENCENVGRGGT